MALNIRESAVQDRNAVTEPRPKSRHQLRGERNFGHEHDRATAQLERALDGAQVDFGLARGGDPSSKKLCFSPLSSEWLMRSTALACGAVSSGGVSGATCAKNGSGWASMRSTLTRVNASSRFTARARVRPEFRQLGRGVRVLFAVSARGFAGLRAELGCRTSALARAHALHHAPQGLDRERLALRECLGSVRSSAGKASSITAPIGAM